MIRGVYIIGDDETPIYWEIFDNSIGKYSDMLSSFLTALITFGEEILDVPERLDLQKYSITFYRAKGKNVYWYFIITDHTDTRNSTLRAIQKLKEKTMNILEEYDLPFITEDLQKKLHEAVSETIKEVSRPLKNWRTGGPKTILFTLTSTFILYTTLSMIIFPLLELIISDYMNVLYSLAVIFVTAISSVIGGITGGVPKESTVGAWIAIILESFAILFAIMAEYNLTVALTVFFYNGIGIGGFAATLAYLSATYYDNRFLR